MSQSYDKIFRIDGKDCVGRFDTGTLEFTEKIDGSQIGFGWQNEIFIFRSKGRELQDLDSKEQGQFQKFYEHLTKIKDSIPKNLFFYGEYLEKSRHNKIAYKRVPNGHCCLFAVWHEQEERWLLHEEMAVIAKSIGMDVVPLLAKEESQNIQDLTSFIEELLKNTKPYLGGDTVEGIVIKNYACFDQRQMRVGKLVSDSFKEVKHKKIESKNPLDQVNDLFSMYSTTARFDKAIQHCQDRGELTGQHTDIPILLKEIMTDLLEEEGEEIKEKLFKLFKKQLHKAVTEGFAEYYFAKK